MRNPFFLGRLFWTFFRLVKNPARLETVFALHKSAIRAARQKDIDHILGFVKQDPASAQAFELKPRLPKKGGEHFRDYAPGTFGRAYSDFLLSNGITPESFPDAEIRSEVDYFSAHLYETHDVWHTVTGFGTSFEDELGLQAFYLAQFPGILPLMILSAGFLNTALFDRDKTYPRTEAIMRGWQMGRKARKLFGADWNALWSLPIEAVRATLGIGAIA